MMEMDTDASVPVENGRATRWPDILLIATIAVVYAWFYNGGGANQHSRYDMILGFVECRQAGRISFDINAFARPNTARKYANTSDWANNPRHDSNLYSNKAPGTGLIGIPIYGLIYLIEKQVGCDPLTVELTYLNFYFLNIILTIFPCALSAPFLLRIVHSRLPDSPGTAWVITTAFYFGTLLFPFSTQLWGHSTATVFLVSFLYSWHRQRPRLAGVWMGMAVLTEYSCLLPAAIYLCYALKSKRAVAAQIVIGALPFALIHLFYHWLCFGNPILPATFFNNPRFLTQDGVTGVFVANRFVTALWGLSFSSYRGLFWYMPVLLLVALPFFRIRSALKDPEILLPASCALTFFTMNLFFNGWHAGASSGPRYLIPALPFMILVIAKGIAALPGFPSHIRKVISVVGLVLLVVSVCNMWAIASVTPMASTAAIKNNASREQRVWRNPLRFFYIGLSKGFVQPFRQSLRPFRSGEPHFADFTFKSFNLPQLWGVSGILQALPCLALVLSSIFAGGWLYSRPNLLPGTGGASHLPAHAVFGAEDKEDV